MLLPTAGREMPKSRWETKLRDSQWSQMESNTAKLMFSFVNTAEPAEDITLLGWNGETEAVSRSPGLWGRDTRSHRCP